MLNISFISAVFIFCVVFHYTSGAVLDRYLNDGWCEERCYDALRYSDGNLKKACHQGCRLFKIIGSADPKGFHANINKTVELCLSACSEAFTNMSVNACIIGCDYHTTEEQKEEAQTIHLLTPLFYVRSAYDTMAHHVRQFISTSWTVYVQEDSGKMIVLQTKPKVVESSAYADVKVLHGSDTPRWFTSTKLDWMDCISQQSGIPRWLLVFVLFGFILALLWLCCASAVTAPNHYLSQSKKKNIGYVLLCEPNRDLKPPPSLVNCDEEAPPLPPKVSLI